MLPICQAPRIYLCTAGDTEPIIQQLRSHLRTLARTSSARGLFQSSPQFCSFRLPTTFFRPKPQKVGRYRCLSSARTFFAFATATLADTATKFHPAFPGRNVFMAGMTFFFCFSYSRFFTIVIQKDAKSLLCVKDNTIFQRHMQPSSFTFVLLVNRNLSTAVNKSFSVQRLPIIFGISISSGRDISL